MYIENPILTFLTEQVKYLYGWYKEGDEVNKENKKKINKYDEIEYDIGKNNKIFKRLQHFCDKINGKKEKSGFKGNSNLHISMVTKVHSNLDKKFHGWYIARIYGGLNGPGYWENYCRDFARLFLMIRNDDYFGHAVMAEITNDCSDDVFTAYISFDLKKKDKK